MIPNPCRISDRYGCNLKDMTIIFSSISRSRIHLAQAPSQIKLFFSSTASSSSINSALDLLNLKRGFSPRDLRDAYFSAAKKCHPDSQTVHTNIPVDGDAKKKQELSNMFLEVSEAYDLLQTCSIDKEGVTTGINGKSSDIDGMELITKSEEQYFREACREYLGVDAETVEESKRCPIFREWLKGKSIDAFHWNLFLMKHGGLSPMLRREKTEKLSDGGNGCRRRRKK